MYSYPNIELSILENIWLIMMNTIYMKNKISFFKKWSILIADSMAPGP
jgi:hypothetical protein